MIIFDKHTQSIFANHCSSVSEADAEEYKLEVADVLAKNALKLSRKGSLVGVVVSTKNLKSTTIKVDRGRFFAKYNATITMTKKFMAHDENEICEIGDLVRIIPCRPMSKMKRHTVLDIIRKGDRLDIVLSKEDRKKDPNKFY